MVPLRSAKLMSRSTSRPSTWWNIGEWVISESLRYTRPGQTMRIGGLFASMVRTCTGEVWVRNSMFALK
ncbi:hypothetical protein [Pseudomonas sp. 22 E 5]|nr:hypothetical protein [Pseudomonas sp. 22 E 5]